MRITNSLMTDTLQNNIGQGLSNLNSLQLQLSTGKQLNAPSDDPAGTALSMSLRSNIQDNTQYIKNGQQGSDIMKLTDSALNDATNLIDQARSIASQAANSTQTTDSLNALTAQVDAISQQLTNIANTTYAGKYIFSGAKTTTPPYIAGDPTHTYQGDTGSMKATIGPGNTQSVSTPGSVVFNSIFTSMTNLKAALVSGNITNISNQITSLDASTSITSTVRATLGAQINEFDTVNQRLSRANIEFQDTISKVEDVDLAQTYVKLQSAQNVYQASLSVTAQAFKYSLTNYL